MLQQPFHLFLVYRSLVFPILVLSLVVVPCWLLYRLHRHRSRAGGPTFQREVLLLTFVVYLSGLAAVTLSPNQNRLHAGAVAGIELRPDRASLTCSSAFLPAGSRDHAFCVRNARGNIMLFLPLGLLIPLVWRGLRLSRVIPVAIAVSIGIELLQYLSRGFGSNRSPDVNDVVLNALGALVGLVLVSPLRLRRDTRTTRPAEAALPADAR